MFPGPDVLCRYLDLKCDQLTAVNRFLEFIVLSLEGVDYHQVFEDSVQTRVEMIKSLRLRDSRDKLCDSPPVYVKLWVELL